MTDQMDNLDDVFTGDWDEGPGPTAPDREEPPQQEAGPGIVPEVVPRPTPPAPRSAIPAPVPQAGPITHVGPLLERIVKMGASDLHIKPMRPPLVRLHGRLAAIGEEPLGPEVVDRMVQEILTDKQRATLEENLQVDFGYSLPGVSRFRATVFYQRSTLAAVFRCIPFDFPTIEDWGLPEVLYEFCDLKQGLVLVTGPTGSGKSSTLAAMLRQITDTREVHIVTIEDPIEFLIKDAKGALTQREVGTDCLTFPMGLRNALRQDPDVIMVGEMRDYETTQTVLTAAETGHLVLSTLHTNSAAQTMDRIMDHFHGRHQGQVRNQLSQVLEAVISLQLIEKADGSSLTAAVEILRGTPRVRKLIEEGEIGNLTAEIESSVAHTRMQSMNQSLVSLVLTGQITREQAERHAHNRGDFDLLLRKYIPEGKESDMFPYCDFSKIQELTELKKIQEEDHARSSEVRAEMEQEVQEARDALQARDEEFQKLREAYDKMREEYAKLQKQAQFMKQEMEARVKKLQERVRQLSRQPG